MVTSTTLLLLAPTTRETIAEKPRVKAIWTLGEASVEGIDRFNILRAAFMTMRRGRRKSRV